MPDIPDWQKYLPDSDRFPLADLGELAARLGSPHVYDRRGELIWYDTFSSGVENWVQTGAGTGFSVKPDPSWPDFGHYSAALIAGSDGSRAAQIVKYFSPATLGRAGLELSVAFLSEFNYFNIFLQRFDGTNRNMGRIDFDRANSEITYRASDNSDVKIATLSDPVNAFGLYHNIKLVIDFSKEEYVRLLYNQSEYDLSGIAFRISAAPDVPQHRVTISHFSRSGSNDEVRIGRVLVTSNEP